ncbi:hypothetical protein ABW02_24545 [Niallia circulans]|jgi:hypothetical protein|uniref:Uncharacterized protein n=2 Tax=Niallia circulans TaxID=1397 RepID=A0A0J1HVY0_NIACI|nr:hypothetical protein [Niallia circulans]KLV17839.1 hypothetical protein ABW02_24545 [Niallia circulans]
MKKLLIIRSVPIQQLDNNLPEIRKEFPDHEITLLTHSHGIKLAEKYNEVNKIMVYPFKAKFSPRIKWAELDTMSYDIVIVPVANLTGAGFFNVLLFSLKIRAKEIYMCNLVSKIVKINKSKLIAKSIFHGFWMFLSSIVTIVLSIPLTLILPLILKKLEKNS